MDVRAALGDDKLDYPGFVRDVPGGRLRRAVPDEGGRFVLDGAVDPALTNTELVRQQAPSFEQALNRYPRLLRFAGQLPPWVTRCQRPSRD